MAESTKQTLASMTEQERRVRAAIERQLSLDGDADIQAGLAWINDGGEKRIAAAAIAAMWTPPRQLSDEETIRILGMGAP